MSKHHFSVPLSGAGQGDQKFYDFFKLSDTTDESIIMTPMPTLFGNSGLHFSFHPSGERHIRTTNPAKKAPIIGLEAAFSNPENATNLFDIMSEEPRSGYNVFIIIIERLRRFITEPLPGRIIFDLSRIFESTTVIEVEDTANLAATLTQLRTEGYFSEDSSTSIIIPECDVFAGYQPSDIDSQAFGMASSGLRRFERYGGFFTPMVEKKDFPDLVMRLPIMQPLAEPMRAIMETLRNLPVSPKSERMETLLENEMKPIEELLVQHMRRPDRIF